MLNLLFKKVVYFSGNTFLKGIHLPSDFRFGSIKSAPKNHKSGINESNCIEPQSKIYFEIFLFYQVDYGGRSFKFKKSTFALYLPSR